LSPSRIELWFSWLRKQQERCDLDQQALREDQLVFVKVLPYLLREGVRLPGSDKYTVQTLGFALVVVGALLFIISLYNLTLGVPITLVIVGVILIIVARDMKPKQETDAAIMHNARD